MIDQNKLPRVGWLGLLQRRHRLGLLALLIFAIGYGCMVEVRGALIHNRHTDVGAYLSASWSIRIGSDPYFARDRNGWHYVYPPLLAVLLEPLADAPPTMHRYWLIPYPVSVGVWYVLSIGCLVAGAYRLATALLGVVQRQYRSTEQGAISQVSSRDDKAGLDELPHRLAWRKWVLFFWPVFLCLPAICRSVIRGQVGPLWLLLLCMMIVDVLEDRPFRAGLWLSGAICLKVIPAFLLIYPLYRRSSRMVAGCGVGLLFGLFLIPCAAMGPRQFFIASDHYLNSFVFPELTGRRIDPAVEHELTDPRTSDTQSFVAVLMNTGNIFFGTPRDYTPPLFAKLGHWAIGGSLTLLALVAAGPRRTNSLDESLLLGLLVVIMLPLAPVCHPHYFMLMIPLVIAVLATFLGPAGHRQVTPLWIALLAMIPLSHIITTLPGMQFFRDVGLVTWVAVACSVAGARLLWMRQIAPRNVLEITQEYVVNV